MYLSLTGKILWTEKGGFCGQVIVSPMALCGGATYHSGHRLSVSICSLFAVLPGTQLQEHAGNDKSVLWHANDFSEGELKEELFTMRFGSIESKYHVCQTCLSCGVVPPCAVSYRYALIHILRAGNEGSSSFLFCTHQQPSFSHWNLWLEYLWIYSGRYFLPHMLWDLIVVSLFWVLQICKSFGLPLKRHKKRWQSY